MTDPTPLAYGLWNSETGKIDASHVYVREQAATANAVRFVRPHTIAIPLVRPHIIVIPLYGPEALATMADNVAMCQRAEAVLRAENIELRNQIAIMRGREVAHAHSEGRKAP